MERRRVLTSIGAAGAAVALGPVLASCTSDSPGTAQPAPSASGGTAAVDPRVAAARIETDLLTLTANVQARWPATASVVAPVQSAHTAHVVALVGSTPSPTPPADASTAPLTGSSAATALRRLAAAERAASTAHATAARTLDPSGARLLASLAAYSAAQDVVLTRASTTEGIGR